MTDKEKESRSISSLFKLDDEFWLRNKSVHLASKGAMRSWAVRDPDTSLLVLLPDQRQVRDFAADSEILGIFDNVEMLPDMPLSEDESRSEALKVQRGGILENFRHQGGVMAATPASLLAPFSAGGEYCEIQQGKETSRERLLGWLARKGYERNDLVWSPGQFVSRGSIVDIFSPSDPFPVRLEFFDDEIESIRFFDPETQKSLRTLYKCSLKSLVSKNEVELEKFLPEEMRIIFFDPKGLDTTAENSVWLWQNLDRDKQNLVPWKKWEDLCSYFTKYRRIRVTRDVKNTTVRLSIKQFPLFRGKLRDVDHFCEDLLREGHVIEVFSESIQNLSWAESRGFKTVKGILSEGFIDTETKKAVLTDLELSGVSLSRHRTETIAPSDWGAGLIPGQWVVHDDYGVSRYLGPQSIGSEDGEDEYLILQFAEDRRLLIPVLHFYKISPWTAPPGQEPAADSLRGTQWKKASARAKEMAEKAAKELVQIYAARELTKGFSFSSNRELMKELENSFVYVETNDQIKAIENVEDDMERPVPMDRLLVGDVGFGKTEVAIRAAGKAAFSGKQVAVLAPTTLLAQQHYETFSSRFGNLPVRVEVVSRFVPFSVQKKILEDLKEGKVDIIIGTHRLLSQDVAFRDLGLVVVDEEHRFGVMHKEHLKRMTPGVDVLMLSATPIPRSLSLSMSGLRDMSVLHTPPQRRLPVLTVVRPWSEELLKSAVLREKNRGGQVFFVHNRINDIHERTVMLKRLFPKLNIAVAHSRTPEAQLEKTMMRFSLGEIDILICTTIVESGLDIPMANTLIVDDAQELGLAQMYQLRGRVGRREEQAYAFLFYPPDVHLSVEASERLEAIAELDELGAGYRLAQRDLQIRGGGDLIGIAQHGNSSRVGYQKYCDMLAEEIAKIKGEKRKQAEVEIAFPAAIPGGYLPQENLRVTLYRRMLKTDSPAEAISLKEETVDRYGKLPPSLEFLMDLTCVRSAAHELQITKIICSSGETVIQGDPDGGWAELQLKLPWIRKMDGFVGPGGYKGITELAEMIKGKIS
jgi:transcription-repair coupling factor (superfamily II helicase)